GPLIGGTILDTGTNVSGSGIFIDTLTANGTSADAVYDVDGALTCGADTCAELTFNTATNSFMIVGSVPGLGVGATTLLTGSIADWSFDAPSGVARFNATGTDVKDPQLLAALGIDPATPFNFVGSTHGINGVPCPGGTCYQALSTDFVNTTGV